ncbi:MAG: hypothetical protein ACQSGP_13670 [Frankia sp.]
MSDEAIEAVLPGPVDLARRMGGVGSWMIRDPLRLGDDSDVISMAGGFPAPESLPAAEIGAAAARLLAATRARAARQDSAFAGRPAIRPVYL